MQFVDIILTNFVAGYFFANSSKNHITHVRSGILSETSNKHHYNPHEEKLV